MIDTLSPEFEEPVVNAVTDYVRQTLPIGKYDQGAPRRKRLPVVSFVVEVLDYTDGENPLLVTAAGPVVLKDDEDRHVENYLKVILHVRTEDGQRFTVVENDTIRAAYIVETDAELGTCKEVAALANA